MEEEALEARPKGRLVPFATLAFRFLRCFVSVDPRIRTIYIPCRPDLRSFARERRSPSFITPVKQWRRSLSRKNGEVSPISRKIRSRRLFLWNGFGSGNVARFKMRKNDILRISFNVIGSWNIFRSRYLIIFTI